MDKGGVGGEDAGWRSLFRETSRDRLGRSGASALDSQELIGVILGLETGAQSRHDCLGELCSRYDSLRSLAAADFEEFSAIPGMTPKRAAVLAASFELGLRVRRDPAKKRPRLSSAQAVFECVREELQSLEVEVLEVLSLDAKNGLRRRDRVSCGTLTGSLVHPREVFKSAINARAASVVVVHNHPSGDPEPSPEDVAITDRLFAAGEIIGIRLVDHVIVGDGRYVSLAEKGFFKTLVACR
ncbi:MAG: DNA repair protein RadC [Planctomycetota bacterium]